MSEAKHTPGPWEAVDSFRLGWTVYADGSPIVGPEDAEGRYGPIRKEEDARLIAAAPDLLAALEEIRDYRGGADNALEDEHVMARVDAALAKARREVGDE